MIQVSIFKKRHLSIFVQVRAHIVITIIGVVEALIGVTQK